MCGIAGIMCRDGDGLDHDVLQSMTERMLHRGPDDSGFWHGSHMQLAFCRLAIVDLSAGRQPIANEDGTIWLVFNGEIYNYEQLRIELQKQGHQFTTNSDSEVIVHLYEQYGMQCVHQLRGMFAFAIWDSKQRLLFCARDPFGIKPLYYSPQGDCLLFASEIKSLLVALEQRPAMNVESLYNFLSFQYVPEPLTMFNGIYKLPPAHMLIARPNGDVRVERYWRAQFKPEPSLRSAKDLEAQLRSALEQSVARHLSGDVEAGCFLSSGIDSTAIAALMRTHGAVKTFSVGFAGANNETVIAGRTAQALGTEHHSLIISEEDYFSAIPQAVWHLDEPIPDPSAIALYHLAKLASEQVKVVLSGEGADELFGGYRIYREPSAVAPVSCLPSPLRGALKFAAQRLPVGMKGRSYLLRGTTPLEQRFYGNAYIFSNEAKLELLQSDYLSANFAPGSSTPESITAALYNETRHLDPVARMQHIDLNLWLPGNILMKADKMSMAHSLELRVPFLDLELFQLAASLPSQLKIAHGTTKYILRKALEQVVPSFIANRPKLGFPVPLRKWLAASRGDQLLSQIESSQICDYLNIDYVRSLLKRHQEGSGDYARQLFTVYILAVWHNTFINDINYQANMSRFNFISSNDSKSPQLISDKSKPSSAIVQP